MHKVSLNGQGGQIQISNEVLAIITGTAALEVEGVVTSHSVSDATGRFAKRNFARGVKIVIVDGEVSVDLSIIVKFGRHIQVVSEEVQKRVKTALETMVGMTVKEINVNVVGVHFDKPPKVKVRPKAIQRKRVQ